LSVIKRNHANDLIEPGLLPFKLETEKHFTSYIVDDFNFGATVRTSHCPDNYGDGLSEYHRRNFGSTPSWLMIPMTSLLER